MLQTRSSTEDEIPKCSEELIENERLLSLIVKWSLAQVVVQYLIVGTHLPLLNAFCSLNNVLVRYYIMATK